MKKEAITITVPEIPPSNNKYIGRDARWAYQQEKQRWEWLIRSAIKKPPVAIERAVVKITYFFPDRRRRDPDNYSGKMIMDGLVRCDVLVDDSFDHVNLLLSGGYDKNNPRVEIEITEI